MYIVIGVIVIIITIIVVAIILYFCLRKRVEIASVGVNAVEFTKIPTHAPLNFYEKEPKISTKRVEKMEKPSRSLPEIPVRTTLLNNEYEEIRDLGDTYNHLQFN